MWDSDGRGSSGGNVNHRASAPIGRTVFINSDVIPEYFSLLPILLVLFLTLPLTLRKWTKNDSKKIESLNN